MRFALMNAKTAIAMMVDKFVFEPSGKTEIPAKLANSSSLKPKGGVSLKVTRRA